MADVGNILQSDKPEGSSQVVLFIPGRNRDGEEIDQDYWVNEGLRVVGKAFRGGTAFPPGRGVWRDDERGEELLFETTVMILSFVNPDDLTDEAVLGLRDFLLRLGRESKQGEVGVVIDGVYYGFTRFDR